MPEFDAGGVASLPTRGWRVIRAATTAGWSVQEAAPTSGVLLPPVVSWPMLLPLIADFWFLVCARLERRQQAAAPPVAQPCAAATPKPKWPTWALRTPGTTPR